MEEIYNMIATLRFPIALSFYLLIRIEGKLENLGGCINDLALTIEKLNK